MTIRLKGITWEHPRGYDCMVAAAARFERLNPDISVDWSFRSLQAFADAPIDQLATEYDLLVIDHPHIPQAAQLGAFARLDGVGFDHELATLATQSVGQSHASYAHAGHQYGLASDAAAQVAVYRPDLLSDPPRTWPEVLELASEGRVLWPTKPIDAFSSLVTMAANNGTPPAEAPGTFLTDEAIAPILERMHRLTELVPIVNRTQNPIEIAEMLSTSDDYLYAPLAFGYTNYSRAGFRPGRLKYIDIPSGVAGVAGALLGGAGIAVSAASAHLPEARRFAFWVASAEAQRGVYYNAGGQPGNAAAWEDERLNADSLDFFTGTRATLEGAYVRPRTAGYIEFQDRTSPWVTQMLAGELADAELVRGLNDLAETLLVDEGTHHAHH